MISKVQPKGGSVKKLSEMNPWELGSYRDALFEGHKMPMIELEKRVAEIDQAVEDWSEINDDGSCNTIGAR